MEQSDKQFLFNAKDHLITGKSFAVHWDKKQQMAFTDRKTIDPEVDYYASSSYDSHKSIQDGPVGLLYAFVQEIMLIYKRKLIQRHAGTNLRLLDFGAGSGAFAEHMLSLQNSVIAVEPNPKARNSCNGKGVVVFKDLSDISRNKPFQLITLWHVLEHMSDPDALLDTLHSRLDMTGTLLIAVPNFNSHDAEHYQSLWAALDLPRHLWHFTPRGLELLLNRKGFVLTHSAPLWFDALYIAYLSEKHKGTPFPLPVGLCKGLFFNLRALFSGRYSSKVYFFKKTEN